MSDAPTSDEGVLDPWVAEWMAANPERATPFADLVPELLELARGDYGPQLTQEIAHVDDEHVGDIPIRIYRDDGEPTGLVVYFHGGGHVIGSIGIMDGVAREIAHASGAVVVSVGYRLAPEDPYPAAVDDCTAVTSWALAECGRFGLPPSAVAVAGESAGGNMAAAVALRLRDAGGAAPVGQVLDLPGGGRLEDPPVPEGVQRARHQPRGGRGLLGGLQRRPRPGRRPVRRPALRPVTGRTPSGSGRPGRLRHAPGRGAGLCRTTAGRRCRRRRGLLSGPAPRIRQLRVPGGRPGLRAHRRVAAAHVRACPGSGRSTGPVRLTTRSERQSGLVPLEQKHP